MIARVTLFMDGVTMRALLLGGLIGSSGCLMAGNYHSARTLEKGESQVGLTFSATRYENVDSEGKTEEIVLPALVPELTYHIGMADNLEVGGRIALGALGMEGDVKYRFFRSDKLHLAMAPAISYQGFFFVEGVGVRLPGILTYELEDNVDLTMAAFAGIVNYSSTDNDASLFDGTLVNTGAAIGFDLHGETFTIRPALEVSRYVANLNSDDGSLDSHFNTVNLLVHLAWTRGKEKKQLDRIERKIDALGQPAPSTPQPDPAPPPPSAPQPAPAPPPEPGSPGVSQPN
jgi:hypothetical protein